MNGSASARDATPDGKAPPVSRPTRSKTGDMKRLLLAAEKGDAGSQFNLAVFYGNGVDDNGHVAPGNRAEAMKWLLRAAEQEFSRAQHTLAEVYAKGPDAPDNRIRACAWFLRAVASSIGMHRHQAQTGFERVSLQMTPAQIATAKRLARIWKHRIAAAANTGFPAISPRRAR